MTTNSNDFSIVIAQELYNSDNPFPVDFDIAWKWLEYSTKGNAKRVLLSGGFIESTDFIINDESDNHAGLSPQEKAVLARKESIFLTVECFKSWAMLSSTEKGKQVRLYFLECEKIAKTKVKSVDQLTDLELSKIYLNRQVDRVAYNQTQANNVKACSEQYQKELSNQYDKTEEVGNLFATLRLRCEGDKSMNQIHLTNTIYKQKRQVQIITEGYDSVPYNLLTQPEKKQLAKLGKGCSAKHLLEANPSSKESELPNKFTTITIS